MSVIVRGMEMPENCFYCEIMQKTDDGEYMKCPLVGFKYSMHDMYTYVSEQKEPHPECPLVALPDKHGDLIDRQKLIEDNKHLEYPTDGKYRRDRAWAVGFNAGARHCNEHAVYAKAVIEAEDVT